MRRIGRISSSWAVAPGKDCGMSRVWKVVNKPYLHFVSSDGDVVSADEMAMYVTGLEAEISRPTTRAADGGVWWCEECGSSNLDEDGECGYCEPPRHR